MIGPEKGLLRGQLGGISAFGISKALIFRDLTIQDKSRDCKICLAILGTIAVITAAGAATLIATSGGAFSFYGGIVLSTTTVGLMVWMAVVIVRTKNHNKSKNTEYKRITQEHVDYAAIANALLMNAEGAKVVVPRMPAEHLQDFFGRLPEEETDQKSAILSALAAHEGFASLEVASQFTILDRIPQEESTASVAKLGDEEYFALLMDKKFGSDNYPKAYRAVFANDAKLATGTPEQIYTYFSRLKGDDRTVACNRLKVRHFILIEYAYRLPDNESSNVNVHFVIAQRPDGFANYVIQKDCTPERIAQTVNQMNGQQKAAFLKDLANNLTDEVTPELHPKIQDIIESVVTESMRQGLNGISVDDRDILIEQLVRWPQFIAKAVHSYKLWDSLEMLDALWTKMGEPQKLECVTSLADSITGVKPTDRAVANRWETCINQYLNFTPELFLGAMARMPASFALVTKELGAAHPQVTKARTLISIEDRNNYFETLCEIEQGSGAYKELVERELAEAIQMEGDERRKYLAKSGIVPSLAQKEVGHIKFRAYIVDKSKDRSIERYRHEFALDIFELMGKSAMPLISSLDTGRWFGYDRYTSMLEILVIQELENPKLSESRKELCRQFARAPQYHKIDKKKISAQLDWEQFQKNCLGKR